MSKSVEEITKENDRSIQDIEHERDKKRSESNGGPPRGRARSSNSATLGLWFLVVIFLLLVFFVFSVVFSETTVTVQPQSASVSVDTELAASSGQANPEADLTYQITTVSKSLPPVAATSSKTEYQESRASGTLSIINESADEIRLVADTRFASPDGKIYRTQSANTVPAGDQVTAQIIAAEAGQSYNIATSTTFTIPGLSGSKEFETVTGQTDRVTGGIKAEVPVVATSTLSGALPDTTNLKSQLQAKLADTVPSSRVTFADGQFFSTSTQPQSQAGQPAVVLEGKLTALTFSNRQIAKQIASTKEIDVAKDDNVRIPGLNDFSFTLTERSAFDPTAQGSITFTLNGTGQIVWQYNKDKLARDLRGIEIGGLDNILEKYDAIESANVSTRPFWKRSFPTDAEEIQIRSTTAAGS